MEGACNPVGPRTNRIEFWERRGAAKETNGNVLLQVVWGAPTVSPCNVGGHPLEQQEKWTLCPGKNLARIDPQGVFRVFYNEGP